MRLILVSLCLATFPAVASAQGGPFDLPRLTFPDPVPQPCPDPAVPGCVPGQ